MKFQELVNQKGKEFDYAFITIREAERNEIKKHRHEEGMTEAKFDATGKLNQIQILIVNDFNDTKKCRLLLHELGHAKDFLTRTNELEEIYKNKNDTAFLKFTKESEYFAFQYSLEEGKKFFYAKETDILYSLVDEISCRNHNLEFEELYEQAIKCIVKTNLWKDCSDLTGKKVYKHLK